MSIGESGRISSTGGLRQEHVPHSNILHDVSLWSRSVHCFFDTELQACFPEAMCTLLPDLDTFDIITVLDYLKIEVSTCTPFQLNTLITRNIVNTRSSICSLISKTNLERLYYFVKDVYRTRKAIRGLPNPLPIYHTTRGRTNGYFYRQLTCPQCIMCSQCYTMLDPWSFVSHCHLNLWDPDPNFSPDKWRNYVHVDEDFQSNILYMRVLTELNHKFEDRS